MLIRSDARYIPLKSGVMQCVVTSPPYWGLRDYGVLGQIGLEKTLGEYVAKLVEVFREVWRVLREDGTLWLNLGDSYQGGNKFPLPGLKSKDLIGIPWRVALALQADGWYLRSDIIWSKPNAMPESVTDRPTRSHEYIFLLTKSARYYWDQEAVREADGGKDHPRNLERTSIPVVPGQSPQMGIRTAAGRNCQGRNIRTVWTIATESYRGAHYATFPSKLVETCILAGSRPGALILDPFMGSGTVVMVARDLGRIGVGCDLTYQELSKERIYGPLFAGTINS